MTIQPIIDQLDKLEVIINDKKASSCPVCGNYRLKFGNRWECPQINTCGIWDRLGRKKV